MKKIFVIAGISALAVPVAFFGIKKLIGYKDKLYNEGFEEGFQWAIDNEETIGNLREQWEREGKGNKVGISITKL